MCLRESRSKENFFGEGDDEISGLHERVNAGLRVEIFG
jgi:hypothetical protein